MKVAVVQLASTLDLDHNLNRAAHWIEAAAASGARLVALPEVFNRRGDSDAVKAGAEPADGPTMLWAASQAAQHRCWLLAGSYAERAEGGFYNCSTLFSPEGRPVAAYRKIHLFDVDVPGAVAKESATVTAGKEVVTAPLDGGLLLGMTVCYDLRFPELYRSLTDAGARIIAVPAAFTERTGRDHWEVLLRARAIENQVFILAPNQHGTTPGTPTSYGRSMIIDPWGTVLAQAPDGEGVIVAELNFESQDRIRATLPCLQHRRPELFR